MSGLTYEKILEARKLMDKNSVPEEDRYYIFDGTRIEFIAYCMNMGMTKEHAERFTRRCINPV